MFLRFSFAVLISAFCACNKPHTPGTSTTTTTSTLPHFVDSISVFGCRLRDEIISFRADMEPIIKNAVTSMTWNFGDSSQPVTVDYPSHTYSVAGTYKVTLTVNNIQTISRKITIDTLPTSPHLAEMEGKRRWVGSAKGFILEFRGLTFATDSAIDSTFLISVNTNRQSVYFLDATHLLSAVDDNTLTFFQCDWPSKKLVYYFNKDSLSYTNVGSQGTQSWSFMIHTP